MSNGTPLSIGHFAKLAGVTTENLPREMDDPQLALDLSKNGDAVKILLAETYTRANLDRALVTLGKKSEQKPVSSILRFVQTVVLDARAEKFAPKKRFTEDNPDVQFGWIDPEFADDFGDMVEEPTSEATLRQYVLTRRSRFDLAMKEIAGEGFITKTTPGELYSMLEMQPKGPKSGTGSLLTNGYANLFEMVNKKRVSRLVGVRWHDDSGGWVVCSYPATYSHEWSVGYQLFSRDSRLPLAA